MFHYLQSVLFTLKSNMDTQFLPYKYRRTRAINVPNCRLLGRKIVPRKISQFQLNSCWKMLKLKSFLMMKTLNPIALLCDRCRLHGDKDDDDDQPNVALAALEPYFCPACCHIEPSNAHKYSLQCQTLLVKEWQVSMDFVLNKCPHLG